MSNVFIGLSTFDSKAKNSYAPPRKCKIRSLKKQHFLS
jgi:hypothetical protein